MGFLPLGPRPTAAEIPASCELYHYCHHNGFQIDLGMLSTCLSFLPLEGVTIRWGKRSAYLLGDYPEIS